MPFCLSALQALAAASAEVDRCTASCDTQSALAVYKQGLPVGIRSKVLTPLGDGAGAVATESVEVSSAPAGRWHLVRATQQGWSTP